LGESKKEASPERNNQKEQEQGANAQDNEFSFRVLVSPSQSFASPNRLLTEQPNKKQYFQKEFIVRKVEKGLEINNTVIFPMFVGTSDTGAQEYVYKGASLSMPTQINESKNEMEKHETPKEEEKKPKRSKRKLGSSRLDEEQEKQRKLMDFYLRNKESEKSGMGSSSFRAKRKFEMKCDNESEEGKTERERGTDANLTCLICFENPPDCVMMSCGHGGICYECTIDIWRKSGECFLCRNVILLEQISDFLCFFFGIENRESVSD
jgi:Zinc finger, C3HC4 type (RING finger)